MDQGIHLDRPRRTRSVISVAPMIDILMILLIFFMVTSTYLDLDMIPAVSPAEGTRTGSSPPPGTSDGAETLLVRIGGDGSFAIAGQTLSVAELSALIRARVSKIPTLQVLILPSGAAPTQALVTVLDTATAAGAIRLQVTRLEPRG